MFGDHPGWEHPRELHGQKRFHRTVDIAELVADTADDEAVVEDGLTGDLNRIVRIGASSVVAWPTRRSPTS